MNDWKITIDPIEPQPSTKEFISAFYRNSKDMVYLRAFSDQDGMNEFPHKPEVQLSLFDGVIPTLKNYNERKLGIFFVVNGGGQSKEAVIRSGKCQAQFMEIDDYDMEDQIRIINAFPLKPSIVVRTRKSLHTYWLLNDEADIKRFRSIQTKFISLFKSDEAIKDESRVMRVPGFFHNKQEPVMVKVLEFDPDSRYSQDEIEKALEGLTFDEILDRAGFEEDEKRNIISICEEAEKKRKGKKSSKMQSEKAIADTRESYSDQEGSEHRHNTLISEIARMKHYGFDNSLIKGAIIQMNKEKFKNPLNDEEMEKTIFPALNNLEKDISPGVAIVDSELMQKLIYLHPEANSYFKWNDKGNGALFAEIFREILRWNATVKKWYFYDGKKWIPDEDSMMAQRCAKQLTDSLMIYSVQHINDDDFKKRYQKHVCRLGQRNCRNTMIEDAKDSYFMSREDFDKDHYLLNLQNGVLNLKTFEFMKHDPSLLMTKICNAVYDPEARADRWNQFMREVMQDNEEKINYLQKILGYSLTGDTREETCYMLYGQTTRNGKSTLVETIAYMLGGDSGYALNMSPETLAVKKNADSRHASSDIARLKGCRFLNASEPPKSMLLDVGLLKTMIGRDSITARFLNENEFQFIPIYKLFINTNFLPLVTDDTIFNSGRINVITFDRHFTDQEQDKNLKDELKEPESMSGILNWCLEGLRKYYEEGAEPPECVKEATRDYRDNSDKVGSFISECFIEQDNYITPGQVAYRQYEEWCKKNGFRAESSRSFYADLRSKNMLSPYGFLNGKSFRNVLKNYKLRESNLRVVVGAEEFRNPDNPEELPF